VGLCSLVNLERGEREKLERRTKNRADQDTAASGPIARAVEGAMRLRSLRPAPFVVAVVLSACTGVTPPISVDDVGPGGPPAVSGGDADAGDSPDVIDGGSDAEASVVPVVGDVSDAGETNASPFAGVWSCATAEYYLAGDGGTGFVAGVVVRFGVTAGGTPIQFLQTVADGGAVHGCSLACVVSGSIVAAAGGQSCSVWEDGVAVGELTSETFSVSGSTAIESATFAVRSSDGGTEAAIYSALCTRD
jgi:hypothetical protein